METAPLEPIVRSNVMDAVADRLRDEILSGRFAPGSTLPSERELALQLGVNRLTLRAALARLETWGLIVTRHGARTMVESWRERAGLETLAALLGSRIQPENPAWRELLTAMLEVRRILAAEAVALAAERHTTRDLDAMEEAAAAQTSRPHDALAFARGDIAFQRAVVLAAGNVGLELLLNTFARFPDEQPALVAALYENPAESIAFYPFVMDLVRAGNANEARAMVRSVLDGVDRVWRAKHLPEGRKRKKTETTAAIGMPSKTVTATRPTTTTAMPTKTATRTMTKKRKR